MVSIEASREHLALLLCRQVASSRPPSLGRAGSAFLNRQISEVNEVNLKQPVTTMLLKGGKVFIPVSGLVAEKLASQNNRGHRALLTYLPEITPRIDLDLFGFQ